MFDIPAGDRTGFRPVFYKFFDILVYTKKMQFVKFSLYLHLYLY